MSCRSSQIVVAEAVSLLQVTGSDLFVIRAVPFLNMDVVSYAAGLTLLSIWPYALVTCVDMLPFNLLVVFLGDHVVSGEGHRTLIWVALGGLLALPVLAKHSELGGPVLHVA